MKEQGKEWLRKHNACRDGYEWAVAECADMQEVWNTAKPEWLIWVATRKGVLPDRTLFEFALWSAEQVRHLMTDPRSTAALDVRRRWLDGQVTDAEMMAAWDAAWAAWAAWAARAAEWAAEWAAARAAAGAAWAAAGAAKWAAEWAAWDAWDAARAAEWAAEWAAGAAWAARDAQAAWFRKNATPNFGDETTGGK